MASPVPDTTHSSLALTAASEMSASSSGVSSCSVIGTASIAALVAARSTHQPGAGDDEAHRVFEREHAGEQRGDVLTEAVPDDGIRFDAERHPLAGERDLGDEDGSERRDGVAQIGGIGRR